MNWKLMAGVVALWLGLMPNWSVAGMLGKNTLKDGSRVYEIEEMTNGMLTVKIPIPIESIVAVNPPVKKAMVYTGNVNFGVSKTTGNTQVQNYSFVGELIARSERLRQSLNKPEI